jgi:hypothetical protein
MFQSVTECHRWDLVGIGCVQAEGGDLQMLHKPTAFNSRPTMGNVYHTVYSLRHQGKRHLPKRATETIVFQVVFDHTKPDPTSENKQTFITTEEFTNFLVQYVTPYLFSFRLSEELNFLHHDPSPCTVLTYTSNPDLYEEDKETIAGIAAAYAELFNQSNVSVQELRSIACNPVKEGPTPDDYVNWWKEECSDDESTSSLKSPPLYEIAKSLAWGNYCLKRWGSFPAGANEISPPSDKS